MGGVHPKMNLGVFATLSLSTHSLGWDGRRKGETAASECGHHDTFRLRAHQMSQQDKQGSFQRPHYENW